MPDGAHVRNRVLIVTEAGDAWPSGRIRALGYKDYFAAHGLTVRYQTRLSPSITRIIVHPSRAVQRVLDLGVGRFLASLNRMLSLFRERRIVKQARGYDVVYLQKVLSRRLVSALRNTGRRLVFDLNDALWLPWMSRFARDDIGSILQMVHAVTCDNRSGLDFARRYNPDGYLVADPPQLELFDRYRPGASRSTSSVVLGWIGSPSTAFNLFAIWEPLEEIFRRFPAVALRVVGAGHDWRLLPRFENVRCTVVPHYTQEQMIREALSMDIGLFPLYSVEDSQARGVLKATVYMSAEALVIASAVGDVRDLITDGVNGLLAATPQEWVTKLSLAIENEQLRKQLAGAGLGTVRERFTTRHCFQSLLAALQGTSTSVDRQGGSQDLSELRR